VASSPSCSVMATEIVTLIEGAGATAADTRRVTEWLHENRRASPSSCIAGASRSTRTSSRSSERGGGSRKLRFLGDKGVAELRSVKARKAADWG